jgi:hypothetical protein
MGALYGIGNDLLGKIPDGEGGRNIFFSFLAVNITIAKSALTVKKRDTIKPFLKRGVYSNERRHNRRTGMKKSTLCAVILFSFLCVVSNAVSSQDNIQGKWKAKRVDGKIDLSMRIIQKREFGDWQFSRSFQKADLEGFEWGKKASFRLVREAGTLVFDGKLTEESGSGSFIFHPTIEFWNYLEGKGFDDVEEKDMLMLCLNDVTRAYIDDLFALGYKDISFSKILSFVIHEVSIDFVKGIHSLGYNDISPSELISFSIHDVTLDFIQELSSLGYDELNPSTLISFSIHDVTADYVKEIKSLGYVDLSPSKLISFSIHGVSVDFVRDVQSIGYKDISPSHLISFRIHDVDRKFIERVNEKWEKKLTPSKIISLKIHEY